jgi:hypothetical protein
MSLQLQGYTWLRATQALYRETALLQIPPKDLRTDSEHRKLGVFRINCRGGVRLISREVSTLMMVYEGDAFKSSSSCHLRVTEIWIF